MCHTNTVHIDTATAQLLLVAGDKNKQKSILKASSNSIPCYIFSFLNKTQYFGINTCCGAKLPALTNKCFRNEKHCPSALEDKNTISLCIFLCIFFSPPSFLLACSLDKTFFTFLKQDTRFLKETDAVVRTDIEENKASNSTSSP